MTEKTRKQAEWISARIYSGSAQQGLNSALLKKSKESQEPLWNHPIVSEHHKHDTASCFQIQDPGWEPQSPSPLFTIILSLTSYLQFA